MSDEETNPDSPKKYCYGCLCDSNESKILNHTFLCGPLKQLFQIENLDLCYMCRRVAQHTEAFIQTVQSNQILLENFSNSIEETITTIHTQTQPLVKLKQESCHIIDFLDDGNNNIEESFIVVPSKKEKGNDNIKLEMKEEGELVIDIEAQSINEDDEFPDMYLKEEDHLKAENVDDLEIYDVSSTVKKEISKKGRIKREGLKSNGRVIKRENCSTDVIPEAKMIYITKKQCLEERTRKLKDPKYLRSVYKCTDCVKGFTFKGSFDTHMQKHNKDNGVYECDICMQRMDSEEKLVNHMRYHLIRYKCPVCGLIRSCRNTITDHYSAYHIEGDHLYKCPQCPKTFKRQSSVRKHLLYLHGGRDRVQCTYCTRTYCDKTVLKSHMMLKHSKEVSAVEVCKRYVCAECGLGFKTPSELRKHSQKHTDVKEFYCVECDKSFKSEAILKSHLKTSSNHVTYKELKLACLHCDKRFTNRRDVERHMNRIHLNVKPYRCDRCDKAYVNAWALKDHQRFIHEGYKRPMIFSCPMCDKVFDRNHILKNHIRTHTGERPYQCSKCPSQFNQASILRTHDRLIHLKLTRDGRPKTGVK